MVTVTVLNPRAPHLGLGSGFAWEGSFYARAVLAAWGVPDDLSNAVWCLFMPVFLLRLLRVPGLNLPEIGLGLWVRNEKHLELSFCLDLSFLFRTWVGKAVHTILSKIEPSMLGGSWEGCHWWDHVLSLTIPFVPWLVWYPGMSQQ